MVFRQRAHRYGWDKHEEHPGQQFEQWSQRSERLGVGSSKEQEVIEPDEDDEQDVPHRMVEERPELTSRNRQYGFHSDSDVLILLPEERMLFTGDVFWGGQLPFLREQTAEEFSQLMYAWKTILEVSPDLETVVPGHSDVPLTVDDFVGMYRYFDRLWSDIRDAREAGTSLRRFLIGNDFKERYPEVADYNYIRRDYNLHQHNIYILWNLSGS